MPLSLTKLTCPSERLRGGLPLAQWIDSVALTANVAGSYTIPAGVDFVNLNGTTPFYYNVTATATVPAGGTTGVDSGLVPSNRESVVSSGTVVSLIAPATCIVTIECFKR